MRDVLVVTGSDAVRDGVGRELERRGLGAIQCPGPLPPRYVCVVAYTAKCPLTAAATAVVLDCELPGDAAMTGMPSWQLLDYYVSLGLPVVALAGPGGHTQLGSSLHVQVLDRAAPPARIVDAAVCLASEIARARLARK